MWRQTTHVSNNSSNYPFRTGVTAALVLEVLGVDRSRIAEYVFKGHNQ